jgi:hypothetical protein
MMFIGYAAEPDTDHTPIFVTPAVLEKTKLDEIVIV